MHQHPPHRPLRLSATSGVDPLRRRPGCRVGCRLGDLQVRGVTESAILMSSPSSTPATDAEDHLEVHRANGHSPAAQEGAMHQELLTGLERLTAVTALLNRIRLQEPRAGVWEAADMQWWWRRPRASDEIALPVWFDDAERPIAAAVLTEWPHAWWLDVIRLPGLTLTLDDLAGPAWAYLER